IRQTCMHIVGGNPCYGTDQDVVSAGASRNHGGQPLSREIDITLQGDDGLQLEKVGSSERTQRYLTWGSVVEPVPCIPTQPFHGNACNDRSYLQTFAREADVECAAHQTSTSVCAHQITSPDRCNAARAADMCAYTLSVLHEPLQFDSILRALPEFCQ